MLNIENILNIIDNMTILELNELLKILEKKFNFNMNQNIDIFDKKLDSENIVDKKNYSLILLNCGDNKIAIIKLIKEINNISLKESKNLVDNSPSLIKDNLDFQIVDDLKNKFESLGAKIEIK